VAAHPDTPEIRISNSWNHEVEPFYNDTNRGPYKSVESRETESVLNALILSSRDAQSGQLSNDAHTAFENMWAGATDTRRG
jgi:squalene-hopene/tetraprenyl-beta-curcumene cyclase